MAEEKLETSTTVTDSSEKESNQDTIDLSGIDINAIAEMSDEDIEKVIKGVDAGEEDEVAEEVVKKGDSEALPPGELPKPDEHSEELEKLRKQVADKENFIQDRNRTVGELRRQLESFLATQQALPPNMAPGEADPARKEEFFQDPIGTMEKLLSERGRREQLRRSVLQSGIKEAIPDIEELKDEIAEVALEDGWDRGAVETFRTNLTGDIPLLKAYTARVKMARELKSLRVERDNLLKRVEEMPKSILKRIDAAAKKRTHLSAGGGDLSKESVSLDEKQLQEISDEELNRMLAKMEKSEQ